MQLPSLRSTSAFTTPKRQKEFQLTKILLKTQEIAKKRAKNEQNALRDRYEK
jgi:hypothetical protein